MGLIHICWLQYVTWLEGMKTCLYFVKPLVTVTLSAFCTVSGHTSVFHWRHPDSTLPDSRWHVSRLMLTRRRSMGLISSRGVVGELQEYLLTAFVPASWVSNCSSTQGMSLAKHVWGRDQIRQPIIFSIFLRHVNWFAFCARSRNSRMYDIRSEWILICYWWKSPHRQYGTLEPLTTGAFY